MFTLYISINKTVNLYYISFISKVLAKLDNLGKSIDGFQLSMYFFKKIIHFFFHLDNSKELKITRLNFLKIFIIFT